MGENNTTQTYYDDVRVPAANLVGKLNQGWTLITNQLNHERVTLCSSGMIEGVFDDVVAWAKETRLADGQRVIDHQWVQVNIARIHAGLEFLRLMNFKVAWGAEQALPLNPAHASTLKVFGTEFHNEALRLMLEILGPAGTFRPDSPEAVLRGHVGFPQRGLHVITFAGGANELQRDRPLRLEHARGLTIAVSSCRNSPSNPNKGPNDQPTTGIIQEPTWISPSRMSKRRSRNSRVRFWRITARSSG
jgi:alkylation response protein AidB-like acyl-CoA dehydrogenase